MRKRILSILGVLAIVALTMQVANAAPPRARKPARAPASITHQFRDVFGSATEVVRSRSSDILWCYEN